MRIAWCMENKSADEIAAHYLTNLQEQFGDALEIGDEFKWEWISIPHFYHVPFYTYAYSFGQLFALALYQMYRQEGQAFEPKYLKILAYGGSEEPAKILAQRRHRHGFARVLAGRLRFYQHAG